MKLAFSVVVPVKDDLGCINANLPSWRSLGPDEIVLCFDNPAPRDCVEASRRICETDLRILEVPKNPEYRFQQAWIRRSGFKIARNDTILTGDIDLQVSSSCLKAVRMVGRNNIGLVSLMKIRSPSGSQGFMRKLLDKLVRPLLLKHKQVINKQGQDAYFTGLYALWRPFWADTEDVDGIKQLANPKSAPFQFDSSLWGGYCGEDTFLWKSMLKKHRCVHLPTVGATDRGIGLEENPGMQWKIGKYHYYSRDGPFRVVVGSLLNVRPTVLASYMHELSMAYGSSVLGVLRALQSCLWNIYVYLPIRIGFRIFFGKPERDRIFKQYGILAMTLNLTIERRQERNA